MNMPVKTEAAEILSRFVAETRYDDLPEAARESAKRCLLDTLGVTAAASTQGIGHKALNEMIQRAGGAPEASVIGFGGRVPVWLAALANGAMARAVDFDDGHDESMTHPSSVVVSAALAMAERKGGVGGRELIAAIALGNEVLCRMGLAIARRPGGLKLDTWFPSSVFGAFGGTAACGSVLGFDAATMRSAFGVVLFEASGTLEAFSATGQSSAMRGMVTGLTAKSCTLAATMAEAGITGVPDSIDGEFGLYRVYYGGSYSREALLGDLGQHYVSSEIGMKPWPTCRYTHSYIDAALQLVQEHDIRPETIEAIRIYVAGYAESRCVPLERQRTPHNFNHAGHALPYLVAAAAIRRRVDIDDLIHGLDDPAILALAERVTPIHDPRFSIENRVGPSLIEVDLEGGGTRTKQLEIVYGGLGNPMSWDDLAAKFRSCVAYSAKPPTSETADRLIDRIARLEDVEDVGELVRALA
jgi:2-methylcitrate dehydratase PrpD